MSAPPPPSGPGPKLKEPRSINNTGPSLEDILKQKKKEPEIILDRTPVKLDTFSNGSKKLDIVFISDTHNHIHTLELPKADLLIHCGDITENGTEKEIQIFNEFLGELNQYKHVVVIAGNHDKFLSSLSPNEIQKKYLTNCIYLQDSSTIIQDLKIYGTPWTINPGYRVEAMLNDPKYSRVKPEMEIRYAKEHDNNFFYQNMENLHKSFKNIPDDADLLITHMPPAHLVGANELKGDKYLTEKVKKMKNLKIHTFGHVHYLKGFEVSEGKLFINAANDIKDSQLPPYLLTLKY
eukprot:gene6281-10288_t